jgi:hypothetical protein
MNSEEDDIDKCTCFELLEEYFSIGKCISSSCVIHKWEEVNACIKLHKKDLLEYEQQRKARELNPQDPLEPTRFPGEHD